MSGGGVGAGAVADGTTGRSRPAKLRSDARGPEVVSEPVDRAHDGAPDQEDGGGHEEPHRRRQVRDQRQDAGEGQERDRHHPVIHSHGRARLLVLAPDHGQP